VVGGLELGGRAAHGELVAEGDVAVALARGGGRAEADFSLVDGEAVGDDGAVLGDVGGEAARGAASAGGGEGLELGRLGGGGLSGEEGRGG